MPTEAIPLYLYTLLACWHLPQKPLRRYEGFSHLLREVSPRFLLLFTMFSAAFYNAKGALR